MEWHGVCIPGGMHCARVIQRFVFRTGAPALLGLTALWAPRFAWGQLTPLAEPSKTEQKQAAPPADAIIAASQQSCAKDCHKEITQHKVMHGPAQGNCEICHVQGNPDEHKFYLVVPKDQLCQKCHVLPHENVMHKPAAEGRCMECHNPHGSEHRRCLVADPKRDLCLKCHTNTKLTESKFVHGPVAAGACIVCHRPHSSPQPKLLAHEPNELCLTCHGEVKAAGRGMHMHAALDQGCTRCHDAHASDHKFQLHESAPGLCMSCHKDKFDQITSEAKVVHGAITEEGGCTKCHEPHSSRQTSLQRGTQPGVCLDCHDKSMKAPDGSTLADMKSVLALNPDHHGPIREGACTACHNPHAGQNFRMLKEDYPSAFYAPFKMDTFKLCFGCHIQDLVLKQNGTGLTEFRDGERNLHYLHVNQEKGRTCRACHEVHASKRPMHIREAVPFGSTGWMLEINFQKTADGGSCSPGCHKPRTYKRGGGLSMRTPAGVEPAGATAGGAR